MHSNGSGGGGDEYSADLVISTGMSPDALLQYFGDQLREQGWMPDSAWSGRVTSGTLWTSTDSNEKLLSGTLRVAQASAEVFHVRFTIVSLAPENYFSGHGSTTN